MTIRKTAASAGLTAGLAAAGWAAVATAAPATSGASTVAATSGTAASSAAPVSSQDRMFMDQTSQVNLAEITLGTYVQDHATTATARNVAARYVHDHSTAQASLRKLAAGLHVTLPAAPSAQQKSMAAQVKAQTGKHLDMAFAKASVLGHQQAIAKFKKEQSAGSNPAVKAYAAHYLPVLQTHLSLAEHAASALGVPAAPAPSGAPATGGGGTAGIQDGWLFGLGGAAVLAGAGVLASRRKIARDQ